MRRTKGETEKLWWSRSEEVQRLDSLKLMRIHLSADPFWTSLFSHKMHRCGHGDLQQRIIGASLPPLRDINLDTVGGKGRSTVTKLSRTWTPLTDASGLKKLLKLIKNPGDSDHDPDSTAGDGPVTIKTTVYYELHQRH